MLNPDRTSRNYILGLAAGAARLGVRCSTLDLAPVWEAVAKGEGDAAMSAAAEWVRLEGVITAMGYAQNPSTLRTPSHWRPGQPTRALLSSLAIPTFHLWTDHPEWCLGGRLLAPSAAELLDSPQHVHLLKSAAAADEAARVLGWKNIISMPMAERIVPPRAADARRFDCTIMVSDAAEPTTESRAFLEHSDPDPTAIDQAHAEVALRGVSKFLRRWHKQPGLAGLDREVPTREERALISHLWLEAKIRTPRFTLWRLACERGLMDKPVFTRLMASPRAYYGVVACLRRVVGWRRNFWPTWLGRRARVGVFGCDAECWEVE